MADKAGNPDWHDLAAAAKAGTIARRVSPSDKAAGKQPAPGAPTAEAEPVKKTAKRGKPRKQTADGD